MNVASMGAAGIVVRGDGRSASSASNGAAFGDALGLAAQAFDQRPGGSPAPASVEESPTTNCTAEDRGDVASAAGVALLAASPTATPGSERAEDDASTPGPNGGETASPGESSAPTPLAPAASALPLPGSAAEGGSSPSTTAPTSAGGRAASAAIPTADAAAEARVPLPAAGAAGGEPVPSAPSARAATGASSSASAAAPVVVAPSASAAPASGSAATGPATAEPHIGVRVVAGNDVHASPAAGSEPGSRTATTPATAGDAAEPAGAAAPASSAATPSATASASSGPGVLGQPAPVPPQPPIAVPTDASAASAPRAVAAQLAPEVMSIARRPAGVHQLTMTVDPDSLGPVTLRARIGADGDVQVELRGGTDAGRDALRMIVADLRRDLASVLPSATLTVAQGTADDGGAGRGSTGDGSALADQGSGREPRSDARGDRRSADPGQAAPRSIQTTAHARIGEGLDIFA